MPREGLVALRLDVCFHEAEQVAADAQRAGGFGDGVSFLRDQFDCLELELAGVRSSTLLAMMDLQR